MTDFTDLPKAGARNDSDEYALVRAGASLRGTIASLLSGLLSQVAASSDFTGIGSVADPLTLGANFSRTRLVTATVTYTAANHTINLPVTGDLHAGDIAIFTAPAAIGNLTDALMVTVTPTVGAADTGPLVDAYGVALSASKLIASATYSVMYLADKVQLLDFLPGAATSSVTVALPPASVHTRYAAIRTADNMFVAADFIAAGTSTSSETHLILLPTWSSGVRYLAFAQPSGEAEYTVMRKEGSPFNSRASFDIQMSQGAETAARIKLKPHRIYILDDTALQVTSGNTWEIR